MRHTSLEEVFLKVAEESKREEIKPNIEIDEGYSMQDDSIKACSKLCLHLKAMIIKNLLLTFRQYKTLLIEILFPIFLIVGGIAGGGGIDID